MCQPSILRLWSWSSASMAWSLVSYSTIAHIWFFSGQSSCERTSPKSDATSRSSSSSKSAGSCHKFKRTCPRRCLFTNGARSHLSSPPPPPSPASRKPLLSLPSQPSSRKCPLLPLVAFDESTKELTLYVVSLWKVFNRVTSERAANFCGARSLKRWLGLRATRSPNDAPVILSFLSCSTPSRRHGLGGRRSTDEALARGRRRGSREKPRARDIKKRRCGCKRRCWLWGCCGRNTGCCRLFGLSGLLRERRSPEPLRMRGFSLSRSASRPQSRRPPGLQLRPRSLYPGRS
mmetsp:Transcript_18890/g.51993  ORF Transcript_18890/g.51993 Transcript_18890/m.51993 type:complete len:290 (-) Transcript_18890:226-1095(-)